MQNQLHNILSCRRRSTAFPRGNMLAICIAHAFALVSIRLTLLPFRSEPGLCCRCCCAQSGRRVEWRYVILALTPRARASSRRHADCIVIKLNSELVARPSDRPTDRNHIAHYTEGDVDDAVYIILMSSNISSIPSMLVRARSLNIACARVSGN